MSPREEPSITKTSAREQHWQTFMAVVTTLLASAITAAVAMMWSTSRDVLQATTRFEMTTISQAETLKAVNESLKGLQARMEDHETRISVMEEVRFNQSQSPPPTLDRRRP